MKEHPARFRLSICLFFSWVFFMTAPGVVHGGDPAAYRLDPATDTILVLSGISSQLAGDYFVSKLEGPIPGTLDKSDIQAVERFAGEYYSKKTSLLSDNTKDAVSRARPLGMGTPMDTGSNASPRRESLKRLMGMARMDGLGGPAPA